MRDDDAKIKGYNKRVECAHQGLGAEPLPTKGIWEGTVTIPVCDVSTAMESD